MTKLENFQYHDVISSLKQEEAEDTMDEFIGRSLVYSAHEEEQSTKYFVHDIQLGFLKEKMAKDEKLQGFHKLLIERFF